MYVSASKHQQFLSRTGNFGDRISRRGYLPDASSVEALASMREQYDKLLEVIETMPAGEVRDTLEHDANSLYHAMAKARDGQFKDIFARVVKERLPQDIFNLLMDEANQIWEGQGLEGLMPCPYQQKRAAKENFFRERSAKRRAHKKLQKSEEVTAGPPAVHQELAASAELYKSAMKHLAENKSQRYQEIV